MKQLHILVISFVLALILASCSGPDGEFAGSEYMPDMAHSTAMEANTNNYYYYNTWDDRSTIPLHQLVEPRKPVNGTIPRGYAGGHHASDDLASNAISVPTNGHVPYHFEDSAAGRDSAMAQLLDNPFPITAEGLVEGGQLYNVFCGTCHGPAGDGLGYLYDTDQNPNAKYPLAPANFLRDEFLAASNGRYYHAIYYGYNAMGAYKDKIDYEERWQVIHYIRTLQAKELELDYGPEGNTLNAAFGTPVAEWEGGERAGVEAEMKMMAADHGENHEEETTTLKK